MLKQQPIGQWKEEQDSTEIKHNTGKHSIDSIQKKTVLRTSHIILKELQTENSALSGGDSCCFY